MNSLHHVWCPVPNIWSNSLKMIHLVTALDKVLCYARRLQSTWPKNIFGRIKLLYPKHLELHFEMQKSKAVTDSPSWDLKKSVCFPLANGWFQPPSKAMAQIRLQSHDFWTYPDDSRRDRSAHAPVLNYQCPGSCLLIPAVGFWLSNWEVGVGWILLSWDDIPLKSQAQTPHHVF